jgi:4-amino-4-deoxy-L-arabinose transferase-like glycosyltransferase
MTIEPRDSRLARRASLINAALLAIALGALLLRTVSIAEPLGIDQSLWASAVKGMSRGQLLYRDVWEQRPPGIYFIYLIGFQALGWIPATVAWLDILASTATTLLLWALGRKLSGRTAGALAAALYAVLTMPAWLYGHGGFLERSVCETFIVVCVCLGALCAAQFRERRSLALALGVGLCAGAAIVLKPNAGLYLPALLLWMAIYAPHSPPAGGPSIILAAAVAALGAVVLPALTLLWLWRLDLLHEARIAVVDFNRFYVGQGFTPGGYALAFSKAVFLRMKTDPVWFAGAIGAAVALWDLARRRRLSPLAGLAVIWGGAAALVIAVNGARLFNSYFIQAFPPLVVLVASFLTEGARESRVRRLVAVMTALGMVILLVHRQYPARVIESARADWAVLRGTLDETTYLERFGGFDNRRGYSARANAELAAHVRAHTDPEDRIFLLGISGAGVYFAADRLTSQRFLRVNFFVATDFPDERFRLVPVARELAAERPRYIIFERLNSKSEMGKEVDALPQESTILQLLEGYRLETQIEDFSLYRRID